MRIKFLWLMIVLPVLSACVTVGGDRPSQQEKASDINVQLGIGYLQQNNLEQANDKLLKALRQNPDSASAHNAYAILQERLLQNDKAAYHYKKATTLDPEDSQANNNYGTFLCRNGEEAKSETYFLRALKNPLYKTPEFAYTNAALCLLKIDKTVKAKEYLRKALAARNNFPTALLEMADLEFKEENYRRSKLFSDQYQLVGRPTPRSLWLSIRTDLAIDSNSNIEELTTKLETDFPGSDEYKSWLEFKKL